MHEPELDHIAGDAVIAYWDAHGVPHLPGVTDVEITAFEAAHHVTLPDDVRAFYRSTDGTRVPLQSGCDHEMYEFYRLAEIEPDSEFGWAMTFADYCMLSWWYAIDLTGRGGRGAGTVYLLGAVGRTPLIVAPSFGQFLELYMQGDHRLTPAGAKAYHESMPG